MSIVNLVFKRTQVEVDTIQVDATVTERHQSKAEITRSPVESGAKITDHIRPEPDMLTLEGIVTNTPLPTTADPLNHFTQTTAAGTVQWDSRGTFKPTRAGQAYQDMLALFQGRTFNIVTQLRTYENMALESLEVPRDAQSGQALRFTATFVQIQQIASLKTINVDAVGRPTTKLGPKVSGPTEGPVELKSFAFDGLETAGAIGKGAPR